MFKIKHLRLLLVLSIFVSVFSFSDLVYADLSQTNYATQADYFASTTGPFPVQSLGTGLTGNFGNIELKLDSYPNSTHTANIFLYECDNQADSEIATTGGSCVLKDTYSSFVDIYGTATSITFTNGSNYVANPAKYYSLEFKNTSDFGAVYFWGSASDTYTNGSLHSTNGGNWTTGAVLDAYFIISGVSTGPALSSEKAVTSFSFQGLTPVVNGVIDEPTHTITLSIPFGTSVTSLVPTITVSTGASVSPDNNVAQNFTTPVIYTVTAANASTQTYMVTVAASPPLHNPVLIVPGILGTEISKPTDSGPEKLWLDILHNITDAGDQFMDALQFNTDLTPSDTSLTIGEVLKNPDNLFNYTEALIQEFQNQGYTEGTDLFLFPYDWRYGVSEDNVNQLKQKITDILTQSDTTKIDIIAHSTGGLIVKKYVVENPVDNHINKAVFVGVPNTGTPKAIKVFIQGDNFSVPLLADGEMKKIAKNLPVAYDLSPSQQYFNIKGSYIKIIERPLFAHNPKDLNFEEANNFLINDRQLNTQALTNAHNLHTADFDNYDLRTAGVDLYAVDGCKTGTIGKFIEVRQDPIFNDPASPYYQTNLTPSYQLESTPGDGTVPLESSTNLPINQENKYYALRGKHGEMLSHEGIRQEIVNLISGSTLSTQDSSGHDIITQDISKCELDGRAISVYSPLSIDIVDQDGNHAGLASDGVSIENNIPNAGFEIMGEHKFVYLPTDGGQTYIISIAGTGTGTFTITDTTIGANNITQTQVFSDISVTPSLLGHINISNNTNTTLSLDTDGNGITDQTLQPNYILDAAQSQNFVPNQSDSNPPTIGSVGLVFTAVAKNDKTAEKVDNKSIPPSNIPVVATTDIPKVLVQVPIIKQKNTSAAISPKENIEKTKPVLKPTLISKPTENLTKADMSVVNVMGNKMPISYKIILGGLIGFLILILLF